MDKELEVYKLLQMYKNESRNAKFSEQGKITSSYTAELVKLFSMHSVIVPVCPHCNSTNSAEVDNRHCLDCSESFTAK